MSLRSSSFGVPAAVRRCAAFAAVLLAFACAAPLAFANGHGQGDDHTRQGHGGDPCERSNGHANPCDEVPEAPVALLYAAIGAGAVVVYLGIDRRRRRRATAAA